MTADEQIDHIIDMMLEGTWKGMRSRRELAKEWQIHERTVGDRAEAAKAVVERLGGPKEEKVKEKLAYLEHLAEVAMGLDRPDIKAAERCTHTYLDVIGAFNHVKKSQELPPDEVSKMTKQEKIAAHKQAIAELEAEEMERH